MTDRAELWGAGTDALRELGLHSWKVFYADDEAETLIDHGPAPDSAYNIRFNLVTDDGRFLNLRIRLTAQQVANPFAVYDHVKTTLINRIRQDHLRSVQ
jgi:hypothetical protein